MKYRLSLFALLLLGCSYTTQVAPPKACEHATAPPPTKGFAITVNNETCHEEEQQTEDKNLVVVGCPTHDPNMEVPIVYMVVDREDWGRMNKPKPAVAH